MGLSLGIKAGLGLFSTVKGFFDKGKETKREERIEGLIEGFDRQELTNPAENIKLSTLKSDQQTKANLSSFATSVDSLQGAGERALLAGLPRINEGNILLQNIISQDLEDQDTIRSFAIARGEERIENLIEKRESDAILGLGQELQNARQAKQDATNNIFSSILSLGTSVEDLSFSGLFTGRNQGQVHV